MITLAAATPGDIGPVAGFIAAIWVAAGDAEPPAMVAETRAKDVLESCEAAFIEVDGVRSGFASWEECGDHVLVRHFVLDPACRGRGLGRESFDMLSAERFPDRRVAVYASRRIPGPKAFWKAMGFRRTGDVMERNPETAA